MSCISGLSSQKCFPELLCLWLLLCSITQYPCYVDNSDLCLYPMRHFTNSGLVLSAWWMSNPEIYPKTSRQWHGNASKSNCIIIAVNNSLLSHPHSPSESSPIAGEAQCIRHHLNITHSTAKPDRHFTEPCLKEFCLSSPGLMHAVIM